MVSPFQLKIDAGTQVSKRTTSLNRSVLMVTGGSSVQEISPFVRIQKESLVEIGWAVDYELVDDRRSLAGIMRNVRRLTNDVRRLQPGIVHAQYGSVVAAITSRAITSRARRIAPLVISFCGTDLCGSFNSDLASRLRDPAARLIGFVAAGRASALIVKSKNLLEQLPRPLQKRAVLLPNGVDVKKFFAMPQSGCRSQLGWPATAKIVLFNAGRGEGKRVKNLPLAQASLDVVRQSVPDVCFKVISDTKHKHMPLLLNAADCLLVTSLSEGSPNLIKEAIACGLPVVSVPCGDTVERLRDTYPGSICPYDAWALGDAVTQVLKSARRSNGPDQLVVQGLTSAQIAHSLAELYARVQRQFVDALAA